MIGSQPDRAITGLLECACTPQNILHYANFTGVGLQQHLYNNAHYVTHNLYHAIGLSLFTSVPILQIHEKLKNEVMHHPNCSLHT